MRNFILGATALILATGTAPTLAAARGNSGASQAQQSQGSNTESRCASILADSSGNSKNDVNYCQHRGA